MVIFEIRTILQPMLLLLRYSFIALKSEQSKFRFRTFGIRRFTVFEKYSSLVLKSGDDLSGSQTYKKFGCWDLRHSLYVFKLQWNAEIQMFRFQTAPKSEQNGLPFPDVRILDVRFV